MEVEGLRRGQRQMVAEGEAPPGVCVELCLNALPHGLAGGLEGEWLSVEGHSDIPRQGTPGRRGICGLRDKQSCCDRLVFNIVQAVCGFDLQSQRAAVIGCDTNVQRVDKQNQRCFERRLQEQM